MKRQWFLIIFLLLSAIPSIAECGMYTYQDVTPDNSGNIIGNNLVQTSCQEPSTSADAHFTMPSGAQYAATAYGVDVAEAVAYAPVANEIGTGSFWGNYSANSDYCSFSAGAFFGWPIDIQLAYTKSKWNGTAVDIGGGTKRCGEVSWCTPETTPPACNPAFVEQHAPIMGGTTSCWAYYTSTWLTLREKASGVWSPPLCAELIPSQNAVGTLDPSLMSCTKF